MKFFFFIIRYVYTENLPETKLLSSIPSFLSINMAPEVRATARKNIILKFKNSFLLLCRFINLYIFLVGR